MPPFDDGLINPREFHELATFGHCPEVGGRTLVAIQPISVGTVLLREKAFFRCVANPTCCSSVSPQYSCSLWMRLTDIVRYVGAAQQVDYTDLWLPSLLLAYLDFKERCLNEIQKMPRPLEGFYCPSKENFEDYKHHEVIKLASEVSKAVVDLIEEFSGLDSVEIQCFILVMLANAHAVVLTPRRRHNKSCKPKKRQRRAYYASKHPGDMTYHPTDWPRPGPSSYTTISLYGYGSKIAHSCSPNLFLYHSSSKDVLNFVVMKPLKQGDILSFSYIPEDHAAFPSLLAPSICRQEELYRLKFFCCRCRRCLAETDESKIEADGETVNMLQCLCAKEIDPNAGSLYRYYESRLIEVAQNSPGALSWSAATSRRLLAVLYLSLYQKAFGASLTKALGMAEKGAKMAFEYTDWVWRKLWAHSPLATILNIMPVLHLISHAGGARLSCHPELLESAIEFLDSGFITNDNELSELLGQSMAACRLLARCD